MEIKKRGSLYYVHFAGPDGRRMRLSTGCTDETQAQLKALDIMREHLVDAVPAEKRAPVAEHLVTLSTLLQDVWRAEWQHKRSAKSLKLRMIRISRDIGHWTPAMITRANLRAWAESLQNNNKSDGGSVSAATKNRYMSCISRALSFAKEEALPTLVLPKFPHWAENNIKERYLTDQEERCVLHWLETYPQAHWGREQSYMKALFIVLIDTGLRISEALGEIQHGNVNRDDKGKAISLRLRHGRTKSGEGRVVPLSARAGEQIEVLLSQRPLTIQQAGRRWAFICQKTGIEGATLHTLRHTCASRLVLANVSIYKVSRLLGHSSVKVTERYLNLMDGDLMGLAGTLNARNESTLGTMVSL